LLQEYSFETGQVPMVKELYKEVIARSHRISASHLSIVTEIFDKIQKINELKFVPNVKNDFKKRLGNHTPN
jgi:hypothetical protein